MKKIFGFLVAMACCGVGVAGGDGVLRADGPWKMEQASNPGVWMPAKVPGTVLSTLVGNGIVPEPYYGLNNKYDLKAIPDLRENRDFYTVTYRTKVAFPAEWKDRKVFLRPRMQERPVGRGRREAVLRQPAQDIHPRNKLDTGSHAAHG